jgi:hypothetical protein
MTKKTSKKSAAQPRRWSLGVFTSKDSGQPLVTYCRINGEVAPYMSKKVTSRKAAAHDVFVGVTFSQARARLLKQAGIKEKAAGKVVKAAKRTPSQEEPQRRAA